MLTSSDLTHRRLHNQHINLPTFRTPADMVKWFGAVQAQDYLSSLWAVGLRMPNATEAAVEQAVADRTIVRTWPMRGTVHYLVPDDIRWMLKLLASRVIANFTKRLLRDYEIDDALVSRVRDLWTNALQGDKQLTRTQMYELLEDAGISTAGQRGMQLIGQLAHRSVICFAARRGKQPTFALLDEWAPSNKTYERDEALAEVARRYFTSHGPATIQDFAWWTGLTAGDAKSALEMVKSEFTQDTIDNRTYYYTSSTLAPKGPSPTAYLLPPFDEYTVAYKDRTAIHPAANTDSTAHGIGYNVIVNGRLAGFWRRELKKDAVIVTIQPLDPISAPERDAIAIAADKYGKFLGLPVIMDQ